MAEALHRLFVAVPVPAETREACHALIEPVRTLPFGRYARWVHLDTLHVTLRFLGDTPPDRVPAVVDAVREGVGRRPAFDVRLGGAGSFPPEGRKIRALWLGIVDGATRARARSWTTSRRPSRASAGPRRHARSGPISPSPGPTRPASATPR